MECAATHELEGDSGATLLHALIHSTRSAWNEHPLLLDTTEGGCGCTWNWPARTSLKEMMAAPSSTSDRLAGGMLPGVMPPTSAWCPAPQPSSAI